MTKSSTVHAQDMMDVANIMADHCYHKQLSKWAPKDRYLGITKRHLSSRRKPDGHKLTVLNKKKVFVGLKRSKRREKVDFEKIKPEITKMSVPRGEIFMSAMGTKSVDPEHKWDVYEQVSSVVRTVTDHKTLPIKEVTTAPDTRPDNRVELKTTDKSLPPMEAQFVSMGNTSQQFNKPDNAEVYSIVVPEW